MANRSYQIIIRRGQTVGLSTFYLIFNNFLQVMLFYNLKYFVKILFPSARIDAYTEHIFY